MGATGDGEHPSPALPFAARKGGRGTRAYFFAARVAAAFLPSALRLACCASPAVLRLAVTVDLRTALAALLTARWAVALRAVDFFAALRGASFLAAVLAGAFLAVDFFAVFFLAAFLPASFRGS